MLEKHLDLSLNLCPRHPKGLRLRNPVLAASGTFGYGTEYGELVDIARIGAIVCKGTTLHPRPGNPQPRLFETPAGLLNSIGLQNIGLEAVIRDKAPLWAAWPTPVIVNIAGETVWEFGELARRLDGVPGVAAIEVNISCPNVQRGDQEFGADPEQAATAIKAVRAATSLPVIVKLTPNVTDIVAIARAVASAGADALTLVNTLRGMAIDVKGRRPVLGRITGGLSGPALKPVALAMVYAVYKAVDVPIIGCGGIYAASDALEFIMAGARAVQVGSASILHPDATVKVVEGLERWLGEQKVDNLSDLVGAAHRGRGRGPAPD